MIDDQFGIEEIAVPVGWNTAMDDTGSWKKNSTRDETAISDDCVVLSHHHDQPMMNRPTQSPEYVEEWL